MLDLDPIKDLLSQQPFNYVHPRHIEALIAEVERVRAENAEYKQALTEIHDMTYHNKWRGEVRTPFSLSHASNCARYVLDAE